MNELEAVTMFEGVDRLASQTLRRGAFLLSSPIDVTLVQDVIRATSAFFRRPSEEKATYSARGNGSLQGWTLAPATGPTTSERPRDYEAWDSILSEGYDNDETETVDAFLRPTEKWPDETLKGVVTNLRDALIPLRDYCEALLETSANLPSGTFAAARRGRSLSSLRILEFASSARTTGLYAHEDCELITLLFETSPGVSILDAESECWISAKRELGTVLVLVGEAGEMVCSGRARAARHRVMIEAHQPPRHSVAWFCAPGSVGRLTDPVSGASESGQEYMMRKLTG
ncbi:2OG-Fe(II) oxygenase family protein [Nonomuraea sp. NPDC004297]